MKRLKNGFTLTEVLAAVVIIGVIAAITIPQLAIKFQRDKSAAVLGKVVQQIEIAVRNYIDDYNAGDSASLADTLTGAGGFDVATFSHYTGTTNNTSKVAINKGDLAFENLGATVHIEFDNVAGNLDPDGIFWRKIDIDTNAGDGPNEDCLDQFEFQLRNDGKMIPLAGSCTEDVVRNGFKID